MDEYPIVPRPNSDEVIEEEEFERLYSAPVEIIALLSVFYGSISILAIIGNTLVIWVVATTRQMRTVTNMYIANLAFADVIIGLFCIPFQFQAALLQRWNLPFFMCGFCPFVQALSVNVSVFTLTAIAIDRHRAVINPLRARPSKFVSKFIIVAIWIVAFVFAIPCAIAFRVDLIHEKIKEGDDIYDITRPFCMNMNLSEDQLQVYRYTLVFVQYLVPFCVISFVYIQMTIKLWGTKAPGNAQDLRDITLLRNKKKVIKMLIIVVIVFGLCWLPLQLYNILYVTIPEINEYHFISIVWFCCDWLAMSNSCYNPFIYGIYNEKFKREFNKRFATCLCKFSTNIDHQDRATVSMHTRASSVRSTYASSSMRVRSSGGKLTANANPFIRKDNAMSTNIHTKVSSATTTTMLQNLNTKKMAKSFDQALVNEKILLMDSTALPLVSPHDPATLTPRRQGQTESFNVSGKMKFHWQNHFKLLNSVVVENEDSQSLLELQVPLPSASEYESSMIGSTKNCVCEVELGSHNECDGICIRNEASRGRIPLDVLLTTQSPLPSPLLSPLLSSKPKHAVLFDQEHADMVQNGVTNADPEEELHDPDEQSRESELNEEQRDQKRQSL